jgi:protein-histidine pros-kinase
MTELALDGTLSEEQRDCLIAARRSARDLLALMSDLLDYSKLDAHGSELVQVPFALCEPLSGAYDTLALRARQKGLDFTCSIEPETPDTLVGDPQRLRQVLINLAANAIKFTEKGEVRIGVGAEAATNDHATLRFSVTDTGIGIPAERRESIFGAFVQGDDSTSRRYGGVGLGLAICAEIVQRMGGKIWVESHLPTGSAFYFTVPFGLQSPAGTSDGHPGADS